jgi:hypothetical protein
MVHDGVDSKPPRIDAVSSLALVSYRIFPSWCTSYLWKIFEVSHALIVSRYPGLAKFFFEWARIYGASFERQECHLVEWIRCVPVRG